MTEVTKNWFALYSKPRAEFKAEEQLNAEDIENYLPTYKTIRQWSDRKKKITVPLLPGYIFIYATEKERLIALEQYSIVRTLSFKGVPAIIPAWQIENLKRLLDEEPDVSVVDRIMTGTRIKITSGSFCDVEGIVIQESNNDRTLIVSIDMLNRSIIVKLPTNSVTEKI